MVEIFGRVEKSEVANGNQRTVFRVPAFSKTLARQRGGFNARVKGFSNRRIESVERIGSGDIPGQNVYDVVVLSET